MTVSTRTIRWHRPIEIRARSGFPSRSNEVLATKKTDSNGKVSFEQNLTRGEGGAAPALRGRGRH
jgi:hypothetical protein